ncbi:cytochrome P450 [Mycena floridula]|nr:cytochrome P450 [Mycena floridula]
MHLPPGPLHVLRLLSSVLSLPLLAFLVLAIRKHVTGQETSSLAQIAILLLIQPVFLSVKSLLHWYRVRRQALAYGASSVPAVQLGSLSILRALVDDLKHGYNLEIFWKWGREYGSIYSYSIFSEYRMMTFEPLHVKALLAKQFEEFEKGPAVFSQLESLLGTGVFNSDCEMWKFHRSMTRPFFSKERIRDFEIFDAHALAIVELLKTRAAEGQPVEIQDAVARFTLDAGTEFLFGKNVQSIEAGLPYPENSGIPNPPSFKQHPSNAFVEAFATAQELSTRRVRTGYNWPLLEFWGDKVAPHRQVTNDFIKPLLDAAFSKRSKSEEEADTFIDQLVNHTQDVQVIQDELINILVASRDTTAALLTFTIYMLAEHPEMAKRLRQEILAQMGPTRQPTFDDIKAMKYLRAFLNETLRLYPPVPINSRTSKHQTTLPNPDGSLLFVPAKTRVIYMPFWIHRREDLWGPDALLFDPDRFLDERLHKYLVPNPFIYIPFHAGPRICLGQQFAYNEASFFLVRLLQSFSGFKLAPEAQAPGSLPPAEWEPSPGTTKGTEKVMLKTTFTLAVQDGMWVKLERSDKT